MSRPAALLLTVVMVVGCSGQPGPPLEQISMKRVSVEGINISYIEEGEGTPLVLVHGIPTSSFLWRDMIGKLSAHGRVIAPDLPGFGLSDAPPNGDYSISNYARLLGSFLEAISIQRATFICHDFGGPVTVTYALRNPDKYQRLVILDKRLNRSETLTDNCVQAGIDERDPPVLDVGVHELDLLPALGQHEVVRETLVVIQEELADHIAPVPETQDEVLVTKMRVVAHHVPENRLVADVHEWLRYRIGVFPQPRAKATAEKNDFHRFLHDCRSRNTGRPAIRIAPPARPADGRPAGPEAVRRHRK